MTAERLRALARSLAAARRVASGDAVDMVRISDLLALLQDALQELTVHDIRTTFRVEVVDLLDEVAALREVLEREHAALAGGLDAGRRHRRADVAYRRGAGG